MKYLSIQEMGFSYDSVPDMLEAIDEPNRIACQKLYNEHEKLFRKAPGSSHNHQAWEGGYLDHVREVMNICIMLYTLYSETRELNFSLADALLVMFLHDIEKPFKERIIYTIEEVHGTTGEFITIKQAKAMVRNDIIEQYDINLTEQQQNALKYVEGEGADYTNEKRVMNELAAFCHIVDVSSARIWHDYGKSKEW